jgi:diguanylate cyclase
MRKKNRTPDSNSQNNQIITSSAPKNPSLINHLNSIINTQERLNEVNFDLDSFMSMAAQQIHFLTNATGTAIELTAGDDIVCRAATGTIKKYLGQKSDKNNGITGLSISTHQIIRSDDTEKDVRINPEELLKIEARSLVIAPLFFEGNPVGVIKIVSNKVNAFNEVDIQTLRVIAGLASSAIAHQIMSEHENELAKKKNKALDDLRKTEKKLKHTAQHDYLTGLPNHTLFIHHLTLALAKAKRKKQLIALMYLDIDLFAQVNESMGHNIGDNVLYAFAQRLKKCIRSSDLAVRYGGDEFILLIDDFKEPSDVTVIAEKILQTVRQPFNINNKSITLTTSIGIAFLNDADTSAEDFLKQAYQALYVSKNTGRNTFYIFNNDLLYERSNS